LSRIASASARDGVAAPVCDATATMTPASRKRSTSQSSSPASALTRAGQHVELLPFELLFEHAEPGALARVEHLVDSPVSRLHGLERRAIVRIERPRRLVEPRLVRLPRAQQLTELQNQPHALRLHATTRRVEFASAPDELRKLFIRKVERVLRLHDGIRVELILNVGRRDVTSGLLAPFLPA